jgi:hypothetical protein
MDFKMNERIKELAEQARHWAHFDGLTQNPKSSPDILFEQKFAELIIEETYKCILEPIFDDNHCPSRQEVKKHFGVEQ